MNLRARAITRRSPERRPRSWLFRAGWACVLLWLIPRSAPAERLFRGLDDRHFPLERAPFALAVDDFNRDGRQDVAVIDDGGYVDVLLGVPGGLLADPVDYYVGLSPVSLASGDLDKNGAPDLVVADSGRSLLSVLPGGGDGTFSDPLTLALPGELRSLALGDLDLDGALDVVVTSRTSGRVYVLSGDGKGNLKLIAEYPVGDQPHSVVVYDFDGDSVQDFAASTMGTVSLFRGLGGLAFGAPVKSALDSPTNHPHVIRAADFNGDGLGDLALVGPMGLYYLGNKGGGTFETHRVADADPRGEDANEFLVPVDFDGDGALDLVGPLNTGTAGIQLWRGSGHGDFTLGFEISLGGKPRDAAMEDLDGDQVLDLIYAPRDENAVVILRGPRRGQLDERLFVPLEDPPLELVRALGKGDPALVALGSGSLQVVRLSGRSLLGTETHELPGFLNDLTAEDLDKDGEVELAATDLVAAEVVLMDFDESGAFRELTRLRAGKFPGKLRAADLDGDGFLDLVVADMALPSLVVLLGPGMEAGGRQAEVPVGSGQIALEAADLDGDGSMDIAVSTKVSVEVLYGDGTGSFPRRKSLDFVGRADEIRAADFDGDGRQDLAMLEGAGGIRVAYGVSGSEGRRDEVNAGVVLGALEVRDVDGDGRPDLIATSSSPYDAVLVNRGLPGGGFGEAERYMTRREPRALLVSDLDMDGILDCIAGDRGSSSLSILWGNEARDGYFRRGDVNADAGVNLTDAVVLLEYLFLGGPGLRCEDAGDADDGGRLDLTDAVSILVYLFQSGTPPVEPGPSVCGRDPTQDELASCEGGCP